MTKMLGKVQRVGPSNPKEDRGAKSHKKLWTSHNTLPS